MKKVLAVVLSFILMTGLFGNVSVKAADFTDDAIVFDVEYTQKLDGASRLFSYDDYKLSIPSAGTLTVEGYVDEYSFEHTNDAHFCVNVLDENLSNLIGYNVFNKDATEKNKEKWSIRLDAGEYVLRISNSDHGGNEGWSNNDQRYHCVFSYNFDTTTDAKITSSEKGSVKVTAPKGDKIDGYEVRYKAVGSKKWTTETVETKKTLNKVFEGLTSGKKYTFQVRKYVLDDYGYKYFSNWTKQQKVKVK